MNQKSVVSTMRRKLKKVARAIVGSGKITHSAIEKLTLGLGPVDYVFVTQYFVKGGAEKVILNYISALLELDPRLRIAIVTTDASPGEAWREKIPDGVVLVDGSEVVGDLRNNYRRQILGAVVNALQPRAIHIVNSGVGYLWARDNAGVLKSRKVRVFASLFNSDRSRKEKIRSYYHKFLPAAAKVGAIERVFTDNAAVISEAVEHTGLPRGLFSVHYQPVEFKPKKPRPMSAGGKLELLWASRIAYQKRPDILRAIAKRLDADKFTITVRGEFDDNYSEGFFDEASAIKYGGEFSSVAELDTSKYDLFLYTSQADGVPNILLEMMAEGMLIVAPDEGGVREIVNDKTGILISPYDNVEKYVEVLRRLESERPDLSAKVMAGQELLKEQHSTERFVELVKRDIYEKI